MSDDLILSGAGSTAVASDELLDHARRLRSLAAQLADWHSSIVRLAADSRNPVLAPDDAEPHLIKARAALAQAQELSAVLAGGITAAAERYGMAERGVTNLLQYWSAHVAFVFGRLAPFIMLSNPALLGGVVGALLSTGLVARTSPRALQALGAELAEQKSLLSNPLFIQGVRYTVNSVDDGLLGVLGAPSPLNHILGDEGIGILGVGSSAYLASRLTPGNALVETPVSVKQVGISQVSPPTGLRALAERIPAPAPGGSQVRIERYQPAKSADPTWIVYVGGTIDGSFEPTAEPWDMTSNVNGIAGVDSGSYTATRQAMREAGVQSDDPLIVVGHSQGGIVASRIASSQEFGVGDQQTGLITFGSPTGAMTLPDSVLAVGVEHLDDVVPALGGVDRQGSGEQDRLLVRRTVYNDQPLPVDEWLPAHSMRNYSHTAELMDASTDERITAFTNLLKRVNGASSSGAAAAGATGADGVATGVATRWRARRLQGVIPAASGP